MQIDTDFELLFPDEYINNISERLNLYNELSLIKDEDELVGISKTNSLTVLVPCQNKRWLY